LERAAPATGALRVGAAWNAWRTSRSLVCVSTPPFAYLAERFVYVASNGIPPDAPIASTFVEEVRRREASIHRKTEWKRSGTGARFTGAAALWSDSGVRLEPAFFTCVSRGRRAGEITYALSTGTVGGIFAYDLATGSETRIVHSSEGAPNSIATSEDHTVLAFARLNKNGSCNLAVMKEDGGEYALVTDGDTIDRTPSWVPVAPDVTEGRHQLVYASTGIGRSAAGTVAGFAPSEILLLEPERGTLKSIASHREYDYLAPRMTRDGTLFAMRRPHRGGPPNSDVGSMIKDSALAPFRLLYAGFRYLDFFSMKYSGRPLATSGDAKGRRVDARSLLERQNVANNEDDEGGEVSMRAPPEWMLVARRPDGKEREVAAGVAAYDVARDGSLLVSDGASIDCIATTGDRTQVAKAKLVTAIAAL
jgi:hypothetical protein